MDCPLLWAAIKKPRKWLTVVAASMHGFLRMPAIPIMVQTAMVPTASETMKQIINELLYLI